MPEKSSYVIDTLAEALGVTDFFLENLHPFESYSLVELGRMQKELSASKLRRIVLTLAHCEYLDLDKSGRYRLGRKLLDLSYRYNRAMKRAHDELKQQVLTYNIEREMQS